MVNLKLQNTAGQRFLESGIDSYEKCRNKDHFRNFPYSIEYVYNSRGFRDVEWPDNLSDAIWCIGDSFTVGLGSPIEHTWVHLLKHRVPCPVINISMDGASNDWIARMSNTIQTAVKPAAIIHQWSYAHRREKNSNERDEDRRIWNVWATVDEDMDNFINCVKSTAGNNQTQILHSVIPNPVKEFDNQGINLKRFKLENIPNMLYDNIQLDLARDGHHYDILTATKYVTHYLKMLKL